MFGSDFQSVIDNANKAFKTAGISSNQYMEQVTSFSASLISSLGGDTKKASEIANRAVIDMADNANTFGSSMESIQNAYQGFAKGNYTMLDNLKLGFGGTKTEMQRLIKEASQMKDIQKELNVEVKNGDMSFANIANAISVMQSKLNIAKTTEKEAMDTLQGSMSMLKASWQNFLAGTGNMGQVVESASVAFRKVIEMVEEAIPYMVENINEWLPELIECGKTLLGAVGQGIMDNLPTLMSNAGQIIGDLANAFIENLPQIIEVGMDIILELIDGLTEAMPELIPKIVEVVFKIIETLADHYDEILEAGFKLIVKLAEGIIKAIPNVVEGVIDVWNSINNSLNSWYEKMKQHGRNLIDRIAQGLGIDMDKVRQKIAIVKQIVSLGLEWLKNSASNWGRDFINRFTTGIAEGLARLRETVNNIANSIKSKLHFSRPDEGPLRDYETWMPDMLEGMSKSLEKAMPSFMSKIHALSDEMAMSLSPSINGGAYSYSPSMSVVVNNHIESDPLGQMVNQIKTFSNGAKNDYNYGYGG